MGDLNSITFSNAKSPAGTATADSAMAPGAPVATDDGAPTKTTVAFAAILKNSVANNAAEKSGKVLPQSAHKQPDDALPPEPATTAHTDLSKQLLQSRSLRGGLQVIVGGKAPTDAGIDAFAKSQGIDPRALALLTDANADPAAAWLVDSGTPAVQLSGHQTIEAYLSKPARFTTAEQQIAITPKPELALPGKLNLEQLAEAVRATSNTAPNTQAQTLAAKNPVAEKLLFKAPASKTLTDNFSHLNASQQTQPAIKLESINLLSKATSEAVKTKIPDSRVAVLQTAAPVPATLASTPTPVVINESGFISAAPSFDTRSEPSTTDTLPEQLEQQSLRKQEEQADMSRRLAEALGQRLSAQISRGAWRVEMDLHPKSLGRIEIQLEMKNGELEANFNASSATTRELLQDSMPRLRDLLEEHGMESAYIGLGLGNQAQSDDNPTAQNKASESAGQSESEEAEAGQRTARLDEDGLDLLV